MQYRDTLKGGPVLLSNSHSGTGRHSSQPSALYIRSQNGHKTRNREGKEGSWIGTPCGLKRKIFHLQDEMLRRNADCRARSPLSRETMHGNLHPLQKQERYSLFRPTAKTMHFRYCQSLFQLFLEKPILILQQHVANKVNADLKSYTR